MRNLADIRKIEKMSYKNSTRSFQGDKKYDLSDH